MSQIPERSRSKSSTVLNVSYNLLYPGLSTSPPKLRFRSLLFFTHSLALQLFLQMHNLLSEKYKNMKYMLKFELLLVFNNNSVSKTHKLSIRFMSLNVIIKNSNYMKNFELRNVTITN